ncbi:fatty acid desaturase [uncultured Paraglaciecola sp.]|uniref:fatty acid desaturase n=1 Tax=uncultured Paraglaciecola sp. TaxID=1765024 RepID=UPI002626806D|nr:fatty acid desaturase [uncultured Paraglaciecola sp.]
MPHSKSTEQTDYASVWQESVPGVAWGTIALAIGIALGYWLIISSVLQGQLSYFIATPLCAIFTYASFTVMHEAGHGSIVKMGSSLKPLESCLGWLSSIPMILGPYQYFTFLHAQHHAFTNDPDRDPDYFPPQTRWYQVIANIFLLPGQYAKTAATKFRHHKGLQDSYFSSAVYTVLMIGSLVGLTIAGYGTQVLYLAIVPALINSTFIYLFFDYIPHHPHKSRDRYKDTRIFPSKLLNLLLLGQNYHLIHHMFPRLPWYKYQEVYEKILPDLDKNGAPIEDISNGLRPKFMSSPNTSNLSHGGKSVNMLLKVANITRLTRDAVKVSFALPKGERLDYKAGQYITVSKWLGNEQQTRCYSLCATPNKGVLEVGVRHTPNGLVSGFINQDLKVGDELIVKGPFGDFVYPCVSHLQTKNLVLIAGGSGITPVLSILETALAENTLNKKHIHLLYACRNLPSIMFYDTIQSLAAAHKAKLTVDYILEDNPHNIDVTGRLDQATLESLLPLLTDKTDNYSAKSTTEFYICGPEGMKNSVVSSLEVNNVPPSHIHIEEFITTFTKPIGELHTLNLALLGGVQHQLNVASNQNLLEVAKANKISLPHGCSNGTCGSCKLRVKHGKVKTIPNSKPGITAQEQANGYTLACQCYPLTDATVTSI